MTMAAEALVRTPMGRGAFAAVSRYAHGDGWGGDPDEEQAPRPALIFTTAGRWAIHGRAGRCDVDPDTIVVLHGGERFRCGHTERRPSDRTLEVAFDADRLRQALAGHRDPLATAIVAGTLPAVGHLRRAPDVGHVLRRLVGAAAASTGPSLAVDGHAIDLLTAIWSAAGGVAPLAVGAPDAVARAQDYLREHLAEPVRLDEVAAAVHLSPFHLHRRFRERTGTTMHRYLMGLRVGEAARLLAATDLPVAVVAARTGFASASHLARLTRQRLGATPSELRPRR